MEIKDSLIEIFKSRNAGPFLFIGSGFSRRYLDLEDWKGLLSRFCPSDKNFDYYAASANQYYPKVAQLLADDFHEDWWKLEQYRESRLLNQSEALNTTSALRIEICNYLKSIDIGKSRKAVLDHEINLLYSLNIDGIITTNWDLFLEEIFPDYKVYIGQEELLFSNSQGIGEIYKIHGCSTQPNSLVLTDKDYTEFEDRNAYLAAKLITLFVEHPIVFIGYSMSDTNIKSLLKAISLCIGESNIEKLRKNLIFVQRLKGKEEQSISDTYYTVDRVQIPIVLIKTNHFSHVYEAINLTKRKIPARVLRYCKEQMYELVQSAEPEKKLCVVDIDNIKSKDGIEFLVGVGVIAKHEEFISDIGYLPITAKDLIADLLHDNKNYDASQITEKLLPKLLNSSPNIPVFKYLYEIGISNNKQYVESKLGFDKSVRRKLSDFQSKTCHGKFLNDYKDKQMSEIIKCSTPEKASLFIPWIDKNNIDLDLLRDFLIQNEDKMDQRISKYSSSFRKLAALYDKLKWEW